MEEGQGQQEKKLMEATGRSGRTVVEGDRKGRRRKVGDFLGRSQARMPVAVVSIAESLRLHGDP